MNTSPPSRTAFTLIEVTLAMGVASFCLLTVFGLVPIGLNTNQNAAQQTTAGGIATAVSADLHGTAMVNGTTFRFQIPVPAAGTSSQMESLYFSQDGTPASGSTVGVTHASASGPNPSLYRATVTFNADPTTSNKVFKVWILVTWPALADPNPTVMPSYFSGSYETVTTLNCN